MPDESNVPKVEWRHSRFFKAALACHLNNLMVFGKDGFHKITDSHSNYTCMCMFLSSFYFPKVKIS